MKPDLKIRNQEEMRQLETSQPKEAENTLIELETLQNMQKKIILENFDIWQSYGTDRRTKLKRFRLGLELLDAIHHAMKINPDLVELEKIREVYDQLKEERELAQRNGMWPKGADLH